MDIQWLLEMPRQKSTAEKASAGRLALRPGDLLTASVLDVEKGSDALLSFGRLKAYARLPMPVVEGQEVRLRVEAGEGADQALRLVMLPKNAPAGGGPNEEGLPIRLFEPVSDEASLPAHSRLPVPGQSLEGRITGFEKNGLQLVDFGKFKAFAKIDIPVRQGQMIPLTVIKTDRGLAFALTAKPRSAPEGQPPSPVADSKAPTGAADAQAAAVSKADRQAPQTTISAPGREGAGLSPPTTADMAAMREAIQQLLDGTVQAGKTASLPDPVKTALIQLRMILNPASPTGDPGLLADRISDFVENSGLYYEKHLEQAIKTLQDRPTPLSSTDLARQPPIHNLMGDDLKPNLLILKQFIDTIPAEEQAGNRHVLETLKDAVHRAVAHIAQQHLMATEKPADPVLLQAFSHPLMLPEPQRNARLKVYYAKKGRDDAHKNPRVSLLLEMNRMGMVRSDLWMVGKDLNITFFVRDAAIKSAIDETQDQIKTLLKDSFNTVAVSAVVSEKKIAEFDDEDVAAPDTRLVDLNI